MQVAAPVEYKVLQIPMPFSAIVTTSSDGVGLLQCCVAVLGDRYVVLPHWDADCTALPTKRAC